MIKGKLQINRKNLIPQQLILHGIVKYVGVDTYDHLRDNIGIPEREKREIYACNSLIFVQTNIYV